MADRPRAFGAASPPAAFRLDKQAVPPSSWPDTWTASFATPWWGSKIRRSNAATWSWESPLPRRRRSLQRLGDRTSFVAMHVAQDASGQPRHSWTRVTYKDGLSRFGFLAINEQFESAYEQQLSTSPLPLVDVAVCGTVKPKSTRERYTDLLAEQNKILKTKPDDPGSRYARGYCQSVLGNDALAIEDYSFVIAKNPRYAVAYLQRSVAYARSGKAEDARRDLEQYKRLVPVVTSSANLDAVVSAYLGDDVEGMKRLESLIAENTKNVTFLVSAAAAYSRSSQVVATKHSDRVRSYIDRSLDLLRRAARMTPASSVSSQRSTFSLLGTPSGKSRAFRSFYASSSNPTGSTSISCLQVPTGSIANRMGCRLKRISSVAASWRPTAAGRRASR